MWPFGRCFPPQKWLWGLFTLFNLTTVGKQRKSRVHYNEDDVALLCTDITTVLLGDTNSGHGGRGVSGAGTAKALILVITWTLPHPLTNTDTHRTTKKPTITSKLNCLCFKMNKHSHGPCVHCQRRDFEQIKVGSRAEQGRTSLHCLLLHICNMNRMFWSITACWEGSKEGWMNRWVISQRSFKLGNSTFLRIAYIYIGYLQAY